jgi:MFS family permease
MLTPSPCSAAGLSGEAVGFISSLYHLSQVVGGAAIGVLSDIVPRRDVLILSFLGSAISYYIVGHAPSLWLLFASRAIVGLVKHTMTISSALVTEGGDEGNRAANIGRIHAYSTLAFIVGPSIGSLLYKQHPSYPCIVSTALFLGNAALCYTVIPRTKESNLSRSAKSTSGADESKDTVATDSQGRRGKSASEWVSELRSSLTSLREKGVFVHLAGILSIVFVDRAMSINNMLSYLEIRYNIPAYQIGFVASVTSVFGFLAQYLLVDKAIKLFGSEQRAIASCLFCVALVAYGEYFCSSIYDYVYFIVPVTTICSNIILTCNRSSISKLVSSDHMGKLLSVLNILDAVAGVAAPVYGAELFSRTGYRGRAPVASLHYFVLAVLIARLHMK